MNISHRKFECIHVKRIRYQIVNCKAKYFLANNILRFSQTVNTLQIYSDTGLRMFNMYSCIRKCARTVAYTEGGKQKTKVELYSMHWYPFSHSKLNTLNALVYCIGNFAKVSIFPSHFRFHSVRSVSVLVCCLYVYSEAKKTHPLYHYIWLWWWYNTLTNIRLYLDALSHTHSKHTHSYTPRCKS